VVYEMKAGVPKHLESRCICDGPRDCGKTLSKISEDSQTTPGTICHNGKSCTAGIGVGWSGVDIIAYRLID
jgi:hypothetical protein